jgi:signal transduction histidine kinase
MSWFKSTLSRIISLHVIAIAITSALLPLALYLLLRLQATELQHRALRDNADTIAQYLAKSSEGGWSLDLPSSFQKLFSEAYGRYGYAVLDGNGRALFSSLREKKPIFLADTSGTSPVFFESQRGEAVISGASIPKTIAGETLWIQVIQDLAHRDVLIDDIVSDFFHRVGWITLPVLLFLLAIDVAIFRRALRPLLRASEMAKSIGPARTDIRLPVEGMPSEVLPLVTTVNEALERLERGFQVQRDFTADAAHELRTPLAILRARVETLSHKSISEDLLRDIARMTRIVSQLLDIAELENFTVDQAEVADLKAVCAEVAEFVAPLALGEGKQIALVAPEAEVWIKGNAEALFRAVRNIAENALRHTPPGTGAEIIVTKDATVSVTDMGPGIAERDRQLIFRRFWRKDRSQPGSTGLGLSIVQRIVEAHAGTIKVTNRAAGGAEFTLRFSLADRIERPSGRPQSEKPRPRTAMAAE